LKTNWVLSVYALHVLEKRGIREDVTRLVMDEPDTIEKLSDSLLVFKKCEQNGSATVEHIFITQREPSQLRILTAYRKPAGSETWM
jgi:hypothetical protein